MWSVCVCVFPARAPPASLHSLFLPIFIILAPVLVVYFGIGKRQAISNKE